VREICTHGSEGGGPGLTGPPYPYRMSVTECPTHGSRVGDTDLRMREGVAHAVETASPASGGSDAESADGAE